MVPQPDPNIRGIRLERPQETNKPKSTLNRDQQRAAWAYESVYGLATEVSFDNYRTLVNGLGANLIRSGLVATISFVQRYHDKEARDALFEHLGNEGGLAHLECIRKRPTEEPLPTTIRGLKLEDYMLATREMMRLAQWLKRACQAKKAGAE